ncbi:uncharacterized protein BP5553_07410 [Venustampulla echinocandica]|uniref:F-box domain-containing protein n=1 Tax=Venustampulla echinocandica TaxID=2656787 RepID=A0A370TJE5_9HELO|nr:uncharacterized protein BP5553_07410 [Venustampulla echinocandica]RDL35479.1 hypothetical protein BP5553_07410 [Venustampulla echinocandica]
MSLPNYQEVIAHPDVLSIFATYLDVNSLVAVSRVTRAWHNFANPLLWADPITIISQLTTPFLKLVSFMRKLKDIEIGRASKTRDLVITLNFKPLVALQYQLAYQQQYAQAEGFITTQWIFKNAAYMQNLRFIMVDGLSVLQDIPPFQRDDGSPHPAQVLLLSTSWMPDINSNWIAVDEAFRNLMFLDISYTTRTEDFTRVYSTCSFPNLRVLKLRGLRLTDTHLPRAIANGHKLWSLDVRDNLLTDQAVEMLLQRFILPPIAQPTHAVTSTDMDLFDNPPVYQREPRVETALHMVPLRPDDEDGFMEYVSRNGNLAQEDHPPLDDADDMLRPTGLTQLYISGNKLTSLGVHRLLHQTTRLQVLDVGSVRAPTMQLNIAYATHLAQLNSVHALKSQSGTRLEVLRIHHSVVTCAPTILPSNSSNYDLRHLHKAEIEFSNRQVGALEALHPLDNPRIRYLCLTDIPTKSYGPILNRLKEFITLCASQQRLIEIAATGIGAAHHRGPKLLTGLRTLRLEFIQDNGSAVGISASGDRDADEFLAQSMGDFSFFEGGLDAPPQPPPPLTEALKVVEDLREFRRTMVQKWNGKLELVVPRSPAV